MYLCFFFFSFHFRANQKKFILFYFSFFVSRAGVMVVVWFVGHGERATTPSSTVVVGGIDGEGGGGEYGIEHSC
jgi:hypothetical protein